MIDADVVSHTGDHAIVAQDYYDELRNFVTRPLIRAQNDHFWAYPERGVPASTVAVPESDRDSSEDPVLLAKDDTAYRLLTAGEQEKPA